LCNFSWALRTGGDAFFCVRNFICRLSMIELHSCIILFISFWNLLVGSLVRVLKLLVVRKDCTFSAYSFESMIIRTIYVVDLLMMGGVRSKHVEESNLTLKRLMSYIYGTPILDVVRSHTTTQHSR